MDKTNDPTTVDWKKFVTINPVVGLTFIKEGNADKPSTQLVIKNKSNQVLIFKIKTTAPPNYTVKPNMAIARANTEVTVNIVAQFPLDSAVSPFLSGSSLK